MNKVVCVNADKIDPVKGSINLTVGKVYILLTGEDEGGFYLCDDTGEKRRYYSRRFISLREYRKEKLKRLYSYVD